MQDKPQIADFIQLQEPANALFYFRAESISKTDFSRHPYSLELKAKKWQSPVQIVLPFQSLLVLEREKNTIPYDDFFGSFWLNFNAMYPHDISPNFNYAIMPEKIVWANGVYHFPSWSDKRSLSRNTVFL